LIVRFDPEFRGFKAYKVDLETRFMSPDSYGYWPSVRQISDMTMELKWNSELGKERVEIAKLISESESRNEQSGRCNGDKVPN